ncbi:MAG: putative sigma-54 modulation protein [Polaribacter sp.]|jgi:putative sigma-54 modulation protein
MKVHINAVHFSADAKLVAFIEKKLSKIDNLFDNVIRTEVSLKLENSGKIKDKIAEIKVNLPGAVLVVKEQAKTFEFSVDRATSSLRRQIIKYKDRMKS